MHRGNAGKISDLMAAGRARRDEHGAGRHGPGRRQQLAFGNRERHVVVIARVAELAGHPAAAGLEIDDRRRRNPREQRPGGRREAHRALVTVRVEQPVARPRLSASGRLLRRIRSRGTPRRAPSDGEHSRAPLQFAAQQSGRLRGRRTGNSARRTRCVAAIAAS